MRNMSTNKRGSGRTSRLLAEARKLALEGKHVKLYFHNHRHAMQSLVDFLTKYKEEFGQERISQCSCYLSTGVIEFLSPVAGSFDWENLQESGIEKSIVTLVDHWTIEKRFSALLQMLHRYDA
jgi:hypothetical protein